jgi:hypothetical protein
VSRGRRADVRRDRQRFRRRPGDGECDKYLGDAGALLRLHDVLRVVMRNQHLLCKERRATTLVAMSRAHRLSRRAALAGAAALLLPGAAIAQRAGRAPLFHIARSKNANVVQYDAILASPTELDPRGPIAAYWILLAEDGRRQALSDLDRRAYGFRAVREGKGPAYLLYLVASPDRTIRVLRWGDRWVAQAVIAGESAVLERLYIATDERGLLPKVLYVDVFGTSMTSGKPVRERMTPR